MGLTSPFNVRIGGERVVDGSANLVHSLHVRLARVEFGEYKKNALDNLPMRLLAIGQVGVLALLLVKDRALLGVGLVVGDAQTVLGHLVGLELREGYSFAQTLIAFSIGRILYLGARKLGGLLKEEQIRTQPSNVFVDLNENFIVFEVGAPLALWVRVERLKKRVESWQVSLS